MEIADLKRVDELLAPAQPYKEDGGKWLNIRK